MNLILKQDVNFLNHSSSKENKKATVYGLADIIHNGIVLSKQEYVGFYENDSYEIYIIPDRAYIKDLPNESIKEEEFDKSKAWWIETFKVDRFVISEDIGTNVYEMNIYINKYLTLNIEPSVIESFSNKKFEVMKFSLGYSNASYDYKETIFKVLDGVSLQEVIKVINKTFIANGVYGKHYDTSLVKSLVNTLRI